MQKDEEVKLKSFQDREKLYEKDLDLLQKDLTGEQNPHLKNLFQLFSSQLDFMGYDTPSKYSNQDNSGAIDVLN